MEILCRMGEIRAIWIAQGNGRQLHGTLASSAGRRLFCQMEEWIHLCANIWAPGVDARSLARCAPTLIFQRELDTVRHLVYND